MILSRCQIMVMGLLPISRCFAYDDGMRNILKGVARKVRTYRRSRQRERGRARSRSPARLPDREKDARERSRTRSPARSDPSVSDRCVKCNDAHTDEFPLIQLECQMKSNSFMCTDCFGNTIAENGGLWDPIQCPFQTKVGRKVDGEFSFRCELHGRSELPLEELKSLEVHFPKIMELYDKRDKDREALINEMVVINEMLPILEKWDKTPGNVTKYCPNPKCNFQILKADGCNHMTCSKCNLEFCWICGKRFMRFRVWDMLGNRQPKGHCDTFRHEEMEPRRQ